MQETSPPHRKTRIWLPPLSLLPMQTAPRMPPASNEPRAKNGANASQVDTETTGSIEKLVSREEQPVRIEQPKQTRGVMSITTTELTTWTINLAPL